MTARVTCGRCGTALDPDAPGAACVACHAEAGALREPDATPRRAAQVEVLRDAAKEAARGEDFDDIDAPLRGDTLPGCVADWLCQRADDMEAGRA